MMTDETEQRLDGLATELALAGLFVEAGWNVYSPQRDVGIDFIATKPVRGQLVIRPVQIKGCHWRSRKDSSEYGKRGIELSEIHPEMALVLAFYYQGDLALRPVYVAFLPFAQLVRQPAGTFRCEPACIRRGRVSPRREFARYFGSPGIRLMQLPEWPLMRVRR